MVKAEDKIKVQKLMGMGFTEEKCQIALKLYEGNEIAATNFLLE